MAHRRDLTIQLLEHLQLVNRFENSEENWDGDDIKESVSWHKIGPLSSPNPRSAFSNLTSKEAGGKRRKGNRVSEQIHFREPLPSHKFRVGDTLS